MKIIKNKTGTYSVKFLASNGKMRTQSLRTSNLKEAKELCRLAKYEELEMAAKAGVLQREAISIITAGKSIKLHELLQEWKAYKTNLAQSENTIYTQETLLNAFFNHAKVKHLHEITDSQVSSYLNQTGRAKAGSREQRHSAVKSLYQFAVAKGYTHKNPASLVGIDRSKLSHTQKEKKPRVPFTVQEYNTIIINADFFFMEATALAWWTGMRLSDIARLEWESFDAKAKTLTVHTKKRDVRICLPLMDPLVGEGVLYKMLYDLERDDKKYMFPLQREIDCDPQRRATLSVYYGRMLARLGITGKSFHCFRHSFVSRCAKAGKELTDIALWVGHSSSETTEIYNHQGSRI